MNRWLAGPFQYVYQPYINCASYFKDRMAEGVIELNTVGDTINDIARKYRETEGHNASSIKSADGGGK